MMKAKKEKVTEKQKLARKYLKTNAKKVRNVLKGILVFDGLSEKKARLVAGEIVEAAASLARGKGW